MMSIPTYYQKLLERSWGAGFGVAIALVLASAVAIVELVRYPTPGPRDDSQWGTPKPPPPVEDEALVDGELESEGFDNLDEVIDVFASPEGSGSSGADSSAATPLGSTSAPSGKASGSATLLR